MKTHKIIHRREKCIGCNVCCVLAPNNWTMCDKTGKAKLQNSVHKRGVDVAEIFSDELAQNQAAAEACPVNIIDVIE